MSYYSYTNLEKAIGCEKLKNKTGGEVFVIMGFQRSGTSLLSNIVSKCGVFFGNIKELKESAITNPAGFFEHKKISSLSWKYLKEAGYKSNINYDVNFHAKTLWQKISRLITVRKMHSVLLNLTKQNEKWGIKNFPLFYYLWKNYLPKHKIIAIYRNPHVATHSFLNVFWPAKFTFEYGLSLWIQAQKDMLYHMSQTDSILIKYEDLIDETKKDNVIQKIIEFTGGDSSHKIKEIIKPSLDRMNKETETLEHNYPINDEVTKILNILDKIKI